MGKLFSFGFLISIIYSALIFKSIEASDRARITDGNLKYTNDLYINKNTLKISFDKVNSTHTAVPFSWDVLKDFPADTTLVTKINRSRTVDGEYVPYKTYVSKVCDNNDKYHNYLPQFLIESTADGNCIRKGHYDFEDAGHFRVWDLVPHEEVNGYYFKTDNELISGDTELVCITFELESNEK